MVISLGDVANECIISVSILTNTKTKVQTVYVCSGVTANMVCMRRYE